MTSDIFSVCAITGLAAVGAATGGAVEDHSVSIGTVASVLGIVAPATWWLSRKFQAVDDRLRSVEDKLNELYCVREKKECKKT